MPFLIFIKTLTGKTFPLEVKETDTIKDIKNKIASMEGVPADQQRMVFNGKQLNEDQTISSYDIKKESIVHLILKKKEENMKKLTQFEREELAVAQSAPLSQFYNPSAGLNDELQEHKNEKSKFDKHSNPAGADFDLGKDGEFKDFTVILGTFVSVDLSKPIAALKKKGFIVISCSTESDFIQKLDIADVAWIISGTEPNPPTPKRPSSSGESYPAWKTAKRADFVKAVETFHKTFGGLYVWADNDPLFEHANAVLPVICKQKVELVGNTQASKTLKIGDPDKTGCFGTHLLTSGIITLYEGTTICYPKPLGNLKTLATSTDGNPVICFADNEALKSNDVGRLLVDCGYTKNYISWDEAGTARYIVNATIWLLGLEHRVTQNIPLKGRKEWKDTIKVK